MFTTNLPTKSLSSYNGTVKTTLVLPNWARNLLSVVASIAIFGLAVLAWWLASDVSDWSLSFSLGLWSAITVLGMLVVIYLGVLVAHKIHKNAFKWIGYLIAVAAVIIGVVVLGAIWFSVPIDVFIDFGQVFLGVLDVAIAIVAVFGLLTLTWVSSFHKIKS